MMRKISPKIWPAIVTIIVIGLAAFFLWPEEEEVSEVIPKEEIISEIPRDWNTYQNRDYDFEIQYPLDLKIGERDSAIDFRPKEEEKSEEFGGYLNPPVISISIDDNPEKLNVEEFYDGDPGPNLLVPEEFPPEVEVITIGGRKAWLFSSSVGYYGSESNIVVPFESHYLNFWTLLSPNDKTIELMFRSLKVKEGF